MKELADILKVSVSTVSKALNDSYEISDRTKERVKKFAKRYNYQPNQLGVHLKSGKTKTIGVILPSILNIFFTQVLLGIEKIAEKEGYSIITCISNESFKKEVSNIEVLSNGSTDGFIVAIAKETELKKSFNHFNDAIQQGNPVVMFDRITDIVNCDKVVVDDFSNAMMATKHLINNECRKIAIVSTIDDLSVGKLRTSGYKKALLESESFNKVSKELIIRGNTTNIDNKINELLISKKVDGIFALDENASLAAVRIVKSKGFKIPEDISIIGYASDKIANNLTPELTTINLHAIKIGESAAQILIERLNYKNSRQFKTKTIKATIVKRCSS